MVGRLTGSELIFIDSNIPMYLLGAPHPHKLDAQRLVETAISRRERLVTSVEVLQEVSYRFVAIDRREAIQPTFDLLLSLTDEVLSIELADAEESKDLVLRYADLSARDALHVATMRRRKIDRIMSFDRGFDHVAGIERVGA